MRPKEAQILGILALLAGAIIVVCLWSGKGKPAEVRERDETEAISAFGGPPQPETTSLRELVKKMEEEQRRKDAAGGGDVSVPVEIEGGTPPPHFDLGPPPAAHETPPEPAVEPPVRSVAPAAPAVPRMHVVQKGDSLWKISEKYYKTGTHWRKIEAANKGRIQDINRLKINTKLVIPPLEALERSAGLRGSDGRSTLSTTGVLAGGKKYYEVKKGDTLWSIAVKQLGDAGRLKELQEANADLVKDPKRDLKPGMRLILP
jgi:nucleoid-associated protein YgaU